MVALWQNYNAVLGNKIPKALGWGIPQNVFLPLRPGNIRLGVPFVGKVAECLVDAAEVVNAAMDWKTVDRSCG